MTESPQILAVSQQLHRARLKAQPIPQLSKNGISLTRPEAYAVQEGQMRLRQLENTQELQIGWKMGLTSEAKRRQMNLDSPLYGFLTNKMQIPHHGRFELQGSIHPKIEPEIAFKIKKDLFGSITREQALEAVAEVASALEILDSRYEQFKYFSMEDVIADNSSSSHFVIGPWTKKFLHLDFKNLKMEMRVNHQPAQTGISSDISGDPILSIVELCRLLGERHQKLVAGSIVLAGAATPAVSLEPDMNIQLHVQNLPSTEVFT